MSQDHVRQQIGEHGEVVDNKASLGIVLPKTAAGKMRVIVLMAVLAITLSGFAVFRVVTQTAEEVPEEAVARAISIEMQLNAEQAAQPAQEPVPPAAPEERPGRAREAPRRGG